MSVEKGLKDLLSRKPPFFLFHLELTETYRIRNTGDARSGSRKTSPIGDRRHLRWNGVPEALGIHIKSMERDTFLEYRWIEPFQEFEHHNLAYLFGR